MSRCGGGRRLPPRQAAAHLPRLQGTSLLNGGGAFTYLRRLDAITRAKPTKVPP
ncbi:hypothetical protein [Azospirillum endophyticum]